MSALGFLISFIFPVLTVLSWHGHGLGRWLVPLFAFVAVPLLDPLFGKETRPFQGGPRWQAFMKGLTYAYVPVQTALLVWVLWTLRQADPAGVPFWALVVGLGITTGGVGITLAHELGHRSALFEQRLAQVLLAQVCYLHFFIEHNLGHHRRVATAADPASSRLGESFFQFLPRTLWCSFAHAWAIEARLRRKRGLAGLGWGHRVLGYCLVQLALAVAIAALLGPVALLAFGAQAAIAVTLLELINYIEHYGLERRRDAQGRLERVQPHHSWNSAERLTNYLLFNLQRHSDHHAHATRRLWQLQHHDHVPQLPTGYAGMIWLALVPPLWFAVMNPRVARLGQAS